MPLAPHVYYANFLEENNEVERQLGMDMGLRWLAECDEIWVFNQKGISKGMQVEIDMATKLNIPIKYMEDNKMDKTYKDIWYDIKEELIDIARWTSTVSLPKLIDKMEVYEKLIKMTITENRGLVNEK